MNRKLSPADIDYIVSRLAHTSGVSESYVAEHMEVPIEVIEDTMLDAGFERCCECGWWCEVGELVDEDGEDQPCDSCISRVRQKT